MFCISQSLSQAPYTCDLCHMARSCSAYNAPHMVARAFPHSLSFYQYEHMTLSTLAKKQKASVSAVISVILQNYMLARSL